MEMLDVNKNNKVEYCIPLWLRDEQIKLSIARVKERIQPCHDLIQEPIAVVCFGPSLNDTWEEIKRFKYIMSTSGAHRFLIDRGIIPNWHVEVDPREHKTKLLGQPHPDVEYLISSTCHPALFDHLEGYNVKLWHVFTNEEDTVRLFPAGEWSITGGCSVGLRALTIARFLGFTDLHVFGMDGCYKNDKSHADTHPNPFPRQQCEYSGKTYLTSVAFLEIAKQTFHELDQMPDVKATFYGDGLVQEMAKNYIPHHLPKEQAVIAMNKPELISSTYKGLNTKLHRENLAYGVGGGRHMKTVVQLVNNTGIRSVLDYGCGKGYLAKSLDFPIWEYDPAIPGKDESPRAAELVVCTGTLEHVEPEKLEFVLADLRKLTKKIGFFVIHTGPAVKHLADGRNTHQIQKGKDWWRERLEPYFTIGKLEQVGIELFIVVAPKKLKSKKAA